MAELNGEKDNVSFEVIFLALQFYFFCQLVGAQAEFKHGISDSESMRY